MRTPSNLLLKSRVSMWKLVGTMMALLFWIDDLLGSVCLRRCCKGVGQVGPRPSPGLGILLISNYPVPLPRHREPEPSWNWLCWGGKGEGEWIFSVCLWRWWRYPSCLPCLWFPKGESHFSSLFSVGWGMSFPTSLLWPLQRPAKTGHFLSVCQEPVLWLL